MVRRHRAIVKRNALAPEHKLTTTVLSGGKTGGGFPGDGKVRSERAKGPPLNRRRPSVHVRPYPWKDMPLPLRTRFARAVGYTLPRHLAEQPTKPKKRITTTKRAPTPPR